MFHSEEAVSCRCFFFCAWPCSPSPSTGLGLLIMIIRICRSKLSQYPLNTKQSVVKNPCAKVAADGLQVVSCHDVDQRWDDRSR